MDTTNLMDAHQEPVRVRVEEPPYGVSTVVIGVNASDLEGDPEGTARWAEGQASAQAFERGMALDPGHTTAVTHHELEGLVIGHPAQPWLDSLIEVGHDLLDLSFLVFTARPEDQE
jgi:hypothetical protein